jgi:hypothetical protein
MRIVALALLVSLLGAAPSASLPFPFGTFLQTPDPPALGAFYADMHDCAGCSTFATFERSYRSNGKREGWFGYGWRSSFESRLEFLPDGSIDAEDDYTRGDAVFKPVHVRSQRQIISEVMRAAEDARVFSTDAARSTYRKSLDDAAARDREWERYRDAGLIPAPEPPENVELTDTTGHERLVRLRDGYQRALADGTFAKYGTVVSLYVTPTSEAPHMAAPLLRRWDKQHHFVAITYNAMDEASAITDDRGETFQVQVVRAWQCGRDQWKRTLWGSRIFVRKAPSAGYAEYWVCPSGLGDTAVALLLRSRDFSGVEYQYAYDNTQHLTKICRSSCGNASPRIDIDYDDYSKDQVWRIASGQGTFRYDFYRLSDDEDAAVDVADEYDDTAAPASDPTAVYIYQRSQDKRYVQSIIWLSSVDAIQTNYDAAGSTVGDPLKLSQRRFLLANSSNVYEVASSNHFLYVPFTGHNPEGLLIDDKVIRFKYGDDGKVDSLQRPYGEAKVTYDSTGKATLSGPADVIAQLHALFAEARQLYGTDPMPDIFTKF